MKQAWINIVFGLFLSIATVIGIHLHRRPEVLALQVSYTNLTITGKVVDAVSLKPLENTHVYIVHGEEEDLTNEKGEFKIRTSQKFPLTLSAEHSQFNKFSTIVRNDQKQLIKLVPGTGK